MVENLRKMRKERNISVADMAQLLGFKSNSSYCKKELGYIPISLEEARKISEYFGKSVEEIFFTNKVS